MKECENCFEEYPEGGMEQHRGTCVLRLVFRCTICNEDYLSREGLWNHLDLHETLDESKELHCQETRAKHKLYQCALCNDQRGYAEGPYSMHVYNFHDDDEAHDQTAVSDQNTLAEGPPCIKEESMASDDEQLNMNVPNEKPASIVNERMAFDDECGALNVEANEGFDNLLVEQPRVIVCSNEESNSLIKDSGFSVDRTKTVCDICEKVFSRKDTLLRHKIMQVCIKGQDYVCQTCGKGFDFRKDYIDHYAVCKERIWLCNLCGSTFGKLKFITRHNKLYHPENGSSNTIQLVQRQDRTDDVERKNTELNSRSNTGPTAKRVDHIFVNSQVIKKELSSGRKQPGPKRKIHLPFTCPICGDILFTRGQIAHHRLIKHTEPKFQCSKCPQKFHMKRSVKPHEASCGTTKPSFEYSCELCNKKFCRFGKLVFHNKKFHQNVPPQITTSYNHKHPHDSKPKKDEDLPEDALDKSGKRSELPVRNEVGDMVWTCSICEQTFKKKWQKRYHVKVRHTKLRHKCSFCQRVFHNGYTLGRHEIACAKKRCHKCNITFPIRAMLKMHNANKHSNDDQSKEMEALDDGPLETDIKIEEEIIGLESPE